MERAELSQLLVQAVEMLGEKEQTVTTYYYEGVTLREIGGVLNLTKGRILQIVHRALAKLGEAPSEYPEPRADVET